MGIPGSDTQPVRVKHKAIDVRSMRSCKQEAITPDDRESGRK
jgi:hypothetical protein